MLKVLEYQVKLEEMLHFPSLRLGLDSLVHKKYVKKKFVVFFMNYSLIQFKGYNSKFKFFDGVQFRKHFISLPSFYLIIWLMESPKNFEKTSILKI